MRIDAHQHYWKLSRGDYGWIGPEMPVLCRDYLPADLQPELQRHRIDKTIVVQAAATLAETEYLLELAECDESIAGVVGWVDMFSPSYVHAYERFAGHPKFVGFRTMLQDLADSSVILERGYLEALSFFERKGTPIDLLVKTPQLDALIEALEQVPRLHAVIDHVAKPRIAEGIQEPWRSQMAAIGAMPNIYCKLSGMVTEADHERWKPEQLEPYIRHVLEQFGPDRVMFGSDWPVCLLAGSYTDVMHALECALPETWTSEEREKLFGGNAAAFYRLK
ncbi:amidohydrolase family protein [Paenibacillus xanthanilyticus]|uniref:Amidohydrolase family protein n=1 Tax=Paenibacillus xanthanilyticus TaxID=1783531 RepID=A0ABV8JY50_9BACL